MIHKFTTTEASYTSTGGKLQAHWPIFEKLRETGYGSIIRATMTLHQVCSSRCSYCSTSRRNKKDSITLEEAKAFVRRLYFDQAVFNRTVFPEYNARYRAARGTDIRLQGLILSGGGQPNLWPYFAEFVDWLTVETDLKLGLITNGFPENVLEDVYSAFSWIRVSITPPEASNHYPGGDFAKQHIPNSARNVKTIGYSYVVGPWTRDEDLAKLDHVTAVAGFDYARVLVDCNLPRSAQLQAHAELGARLLKLGLVREDGTPTSEVFHQLKYHGTPEEAEDLWDEGQCFLQAYNTFWDTTEHEEHGKSWCYPCDSVTVLAEESRDVELSEQDKTQVGDMFESAFGFKVEPRRLIQLGKPSARRFEPAWGTVTNDQVADLYVKPLRAFFDPREQCSACLFMRNNQVAKNLRETAGILSPKDVSNLEHVEFP